MATVPPVLTGFSAASPTIVSELSQSMFIPVVPVRRVQVPVVDVVDVIAVVDLLVSALLVVCVRVRRADHVRLRSRYADLRLLVVEGCNPPGPPPEQGADGRG